MVLAAGLAAAVALAALTWRALPSAGEGEVLVLENRAFSGPIRVLASPLGRRAVVPAQEDLSVEVPLALGEGSSWPLVARVTLRVDPQALDGSGRQALLAGTVKAGLGERARAAVEAAVESIGKERVLGRPAALADPVARELARDLPAGLAIEGVEIRVDAPPSRLAPPRSRRRARPWSSRSRASSTSVSTGWTGRFSARSWPGASCLTSGGWRARGCGPRSSPSSR